VLIIALVVFGPKRLPELGHSLGRGIREFRSTVSGSDSDSDSSSPAGGQTGDETATRQRPELHHRKDDTEPAVDGEIVTEKRD